MLTVKCLGFGMVTAVLALGLGLVAGLSGWGLYTVVVIPLIVGGGLALALDS